MQNVTKGSNILEIFFKTYPSSINTLTIKNIEVLLFKIYNYYSNTKVDKKFEDYIKITFSYLIIEKNYKYFTVLLDKVNLFFIFHLIFSLINL